MTQLAIPPAASRQARKHVSAATERPPHRPRIHVDGMRFRQATQPIRLQGVTYGPFAPGEDGTQFPSAARLRSDFGQMMSAGFNAIRVYHVPPQRLLQVADEQGMQVLIDVPWRKHLCFLDSAEAQREARLAVQQAAEVGQDYSSVLAYSIGNEIPADILRWHGRRRVERFLSELCDVVKQTDSSSLVTYANFPPTEYLDLPFLDFATFNVYLHDRAAFRRYLFRLQNLVGDKPLVLGEIGMDTLRHGEVAQADFLSGHVTECQMMGLAGAFVFSWTDDWHTGGHPIDDWAFGITRRDRSPKASLHAMQEVHERTPADALLSELSSRPRVSVVVCSFNGGATLRECLTSLLALDYPDYEVIVIDDGSTDHTPQILADFPEVRAIRQTNRGLSVARNVGAQAATGSIVAYTDSDCFVNPDWLTHLVYQLQRSGADAVGGPNLTPADGWLASCVAASPGQPTHVLHSDQEAEHIPGCNMAFRRESLLAINGFDPLFRTAGDDVDVCWRLQHAGGWITFAPGAFVWHHRRQGPRAYLRQQAGYGAAEALLYSKHPEKFNGRGEGKWRGVLYGASLQGLCLGKAIVYRGTYATGLFQCIYRPAPAHWAMLPCTLEWHVVATCVALAAWLWLPLLAVAGSMLCLSLLIAILQSIQARVTAEHDGFLSRLVVAALCYAQPLVRSWARYRHAAARPTAGGKELSSSNVRAPQVSWTGSGSIAYWTEEWRDRTELLAGVVQRLDDLRWPKVIDAGWSDGDLEIWRHAWTATQICTTQEEHGGKRRLIRVRYRIRLRGIAKVTILAVSVTLIGVAAGAPVSLTIGGAALLMSGWVAMWWRGARFASHLLQVIEEAAGEMRMIRCPAIEVERPATLESV
jgi:O-antigen biosynthesis protein